MLLAAPLLIGLLWSALFITPLRNHYLETPAVYWPYIWAIGFVAEFIALRTAAELNAGVMAVVRAPHSLWAGEAALFGRYAVYTLQLCVVLLLPVLTAQLAPLYVIPRVCASDGSIDRVCALTALLLRLSPFIYLPLLTAMLCAPAVLQAVRGLESTLYARRYMVGKRLVNFALPHDAAAAAEGAADGAAAGAVYSDSAAAVAPTAAEDIAAAAVPAVDAAL